MSQSSKDFKELQDFWYKKLAEEGFEDLEDSNGNLKSWASSMFKHHFNSVTYQAREEYYRLAGQFLHTYDFKSESDRAIWEAHAAGISRSKLVGMYGWHGHNLVQKLQKIMAGKCRKKI